MEPYELQLLWVEGWGLWGIFSIVGNDIVVISWVVLEAVSGLEIENPLPATTTNAAVLGTTITIFVTSYIKNSLNY